MSDLNLSGLDVLLVEDDPMLRKREAALLQRLGAEVSAVDNLEGARRLLATMPFDFAVLDVNLPDGLGTELLKEKLFGPDTAVIVVTAHGGVAGAVESMRLGAADYLVKPFETEEHWARRFGYLEHPGYDYLHTLANECPKRIANGRTCKNDCDRILNRHPIVKNGNVQMQLARCWR